MRRRKRVAIFRIALAVGLVAVFMPTAAQGKPLPRADSESHKQGMPVYVIGSLSPGGSLSPDDRSHERTAGGVAVSNSPDDRTYSRASTLETTSTPSGDGISVDVNPYVVTGFGLALMLALGMGLAIRHSRKTRLSPA